MRTATSDLRDIRVSVEGCHSHSVAIGLGYWASIHYRKCAALISAWQKNATFSHEVQCVGPMIIEDARRVLELKAANHAKTLENSSGRFSSCSWDVFHSHTCITALNASGAIPPSIYASVFSGLKTAARWHRCCGGCRRMRGIGLRVVRRGVRC